MWENVYLSGDPVGPILPNLRLTFDWSVCNNDRTEIPKSKQMSEKMWQAGRWYYIYIHCDDWGRVLEGDGDAKTHEACVNTLWPRQNGRHFLDGIFKYMWLIENVWISIQISMKFLSKGPINNIPALAQIMAWRRPGDKPLYEPMMVNLLTHICTTRPQWGQMGYSCLNQSIYLKFIISGHY